MVLCDFFRSWSKKAGSGIRLQYRFFFCVCINYIFCLQVVCSLNALSRLGVYDLLMEILIKAITCMFF